MRTACRAATKPASNSPSSKMHSDSRVRMWSPGPKLLLTQVIADGGDGRGQHVGRLTVLIQVVGEAQVDAGGHP